NWNKKSGAFGSLHWAILCANARAPLTFELHHFGARARCPTSTRCRSKRLFSPSLCPFKSRVYLFCSFTAVRSTSSPFAFLSSALQAHHWHPVTTPVSCPDDLEYLRVPVGSRGWPVVARTSTHTRHTVERR